MRSPTEAYHSPGPGVRPATTAARPTKRARRAPLSSSTSSSAAAAAAAAAAARQDEVRAALASTHASHASSAATAPTAAPTAAALAIGTGMNDLHSETALDEMDRHTTRELAGMRYRRTHDLLNLVLDGRTLDTLRPIPSPYSHFDRSTIQRHTQHVRADLDRRVQVHHRRMDRLDRTMVVGPTYASASSSSGPGERETHEEPRVFVGVGPVRAATPPWARSELPDSIQGPPPLPTLGFDPVGEQPPAEQPPAEQPPAEQPPAEQQHDEPMLPATADATTDRVTLPTPNETTTLEVVPEPQVLQVQSETQQEPMQVDDHPPDSVVAATTTTTTTTTTTSTGQTIAPPSAAATAAEELPAAAATTEDQTDPAPLHPSADEHQAPVLRPDARPPQPPQHSEPVPIDAPTEPEVPPTQTSPSLERTPLLVDETDDKVKKVQPAATTEQHHAVVESQGDQSPPAEAQGQDEVVAQTPAPAPAPATTTTTTTGSSVRADHATTQGQAPAPTDTPTGGAPPTDDAPSTVAVVVDTPTTDNVLPPGPPGTNDHASAAESAPTTTTKPPPTTELPPTTEPPTTTEPPPTTEPPTTTPTPSH